MTLYKLKRKLKIADNNAGSADYKALSPAMKRVFTSVVNTFLDDYLDKIKCPTLLIWGDKDRDTPVRMAKKMKSTYRIAVLSYLKTADTSAFWRIR